jgi:ligand-binding sensor domain-containing protein
LARPPGTEGQTYYGHVDRAGQVWVAQAGFFGRWDGVQWVESSHAASVTREFRGAGQARDGALLVVADSHLLRLEGELMVGRRPLEQTIPPVWQLTEDSDGRVWLPSWGAGLYYLGPKGAVHRLSARDGLLSDSFRFVFEDRERNLWTGGGNGGGLIRLKTRTVQTYGLESGLPERLVKAVEEDGAGKIILGTYGKGLVRFADGHAVPWGEPALGAGGLYVQCLRADRRGRLWVGTYGSGLQLWERGQCGFLRRPRAAGATSTPCSRIPAGGSGWGPTSPRCSTPIWALCGRRRSTAGCCVR